VNRIAAAAAQRLFGNCSNAPTAGGLTYPKSEAGVDAVGPGANPTERLTERGRPAVATGSCVAVQRRLLRRE
jgi:hypothetical protein